MLPKSFFSAKARQTSRRATPGRRSFRDMSDLATVASEFARSPLTGDTSKYNFVTRLARGSSGTVEVWEEAESHRKVAIKFINRKNNDFPANYPYVSREVLVLSKLKHPHVVNFHEVFLTENYIAIVMTFVPGGNLAGHLQLQSTGSLSEIKARWLFQQLILIREFCVRKEICHRDIKPSNLLMGTNDRLILADFGLGKQLTESAIKTLVGTPLYAAPEILAGAMVAYNGESSDVWSCGVVLLEMLYGLERIAKFYKDQEGPIFTTFDFKDELPSGSSSSTACQDLLGKIFVSDPSQRISISGIMEHEWFKEALPPGSLQMNSKYLEAPARKQSSDRISRILERAKSEARSIPAGGPSRRGSSPRVAGA